MSGKTTNANSWDAARIIANMSDEQKLRVKDRLSLEKLQSSLSGRKYNNKLLTFVEKKLDGEKK